jgi:hypothetical protein
VYGKHDCQIHENYCQGLPVYILLLKLAAIDFWPLGFGSYTIDGDKKSGHAPGRD